MDFGVLILGSDINAYAMARSYHELYGTKVDLMARRVIGVTEYSNIVHFIPAPDINSPQGFIVALNAYAQKSPYPKIILVATNDEFVRLVVENQTQLDARFVHNYPTREIMNTCLVKDIFYTTYGSVLPIPKTVIYSCKDKKPLVDEFEYPLIVKPGNGVAYHHHPFEGMSKVYKVHSFEELLSVVSKIENSGYTDNLIIQEFIPGDDSALFDAVFYCGTDKKVKLMTFAQIGLQERTHTGIGNCTVLVNGFGEHGYREDLILQLKDFFEAIGYQGFAEVDLRYDLRDGTYKVLEINPRQARSSYYLTAGGHNMMKYLIDDCIHHTPMPLTIMREKVALSFVPNMIIQKYVTSKPLLHEINQLRAAGKLVRPLHYKKDTNMLRKLYLFLKDVNYILKYRTLTW